MESGALLQSSEIEPEEKDTLGRSDEMTPVYGSIDVQVPISELWRIFSRPNRWAYWNHCMFWAHNKELRLGTWLFWAFQPIKWWYFYKMFAIATIVELEKEHKVTWEVTALPGFYARHTFMMEDLGNGRTRFTSWEKAMGAQIRSSLMRRFWISHFTFVKDKSLEGVKRLEQIYQCDRKITDQALRATRHRSAATRTMAVIIPLVSILLAGWFYQVYLRLRTVEIVPGVAAILAGGGNSLLVEDHGHALLVDTKFPPGSIMLRLLISQRTRTPVSMIVNTHYHYDHTYGNVEYPGARIYAYRNVPALMRLHDGKFWDRHRAAIPNILVGEQTTIAVGSQRVTLVYPGPAHTAGDLYVVLHRNGREIVATGDLVFNTYYPMMDLGEGGMNLEGLRKAVATLASKYPKATFIPGHGPVANAHDLERYAAYLQWLSDTIARARQEHLSEQQLLADVAPSGFGLHRLPSLHDYQLCISSEKLDLRWTYELETGTRTAGAMCNF